MRKESPREKLEAMFGEIPSEKPSQKGKPPAGPPETKPKEQVKTETAVALAFKEPHVSIEGRRDPFSGGTLTMQILKKPKQTDIRLSYAPEIVTFRRTPILITPSAEKPTREKPEKITSILKPEKPTVEPITISPSTVEKILPPESAVKPEVSPLIVPQVECPLVYRGSLMMEGIEYMFIEGKSRTYRVTIGDTVEGFRIIKKENKRLYLSREGVICELPVE